MGKQDFKISDLMPNSWFYKLRDMSKANRIQSSSFTNKRNHHAQSTNTAIPTTPKPLPNRASYYLSTKERDRFPIKHNPKAIDIHFPADPPKKTNQNTTKLPKNPPLIPKTPPYECDVYTEEDIMKKLDSFTNFEENPEAAEVKLRPIVTKTKEKDLELEQPSSPSLRSRRLRVYRTSNPLMKSFAVVKSSLDPQRDFRESMMEMIRENGIYKGKDLEELLRCFLSLNSSVYHAVIVKVFEQIWLDLGDDGLWSDN